MNLIMKMTILTLRMAQHGEGLHRNDDGNEDDNNNNDDDGDDADAHDDNDDGGDDDDDVKDGQGRGSPLFE